LAGALEEGRRAFREKFGRTLAGTILSSSIRTPMSRCRGWTAGRRAGFDKMREAVARAGLNPASIVALARGRLIVN